LLPPPNMKPNDILFHVLKVVADMLTDEHVRLIIDGVTYPLLGIPVRVVPYVANREILVAAHVNGNGVFADDAYLDRVIVTQNEPT